MVDDGALTYLLSIGLETCSFTFSCPFNIIRLYFVLIITYTYYLIYVYCSSALSCRFDFLSLVLFVAFVKTSDNNNNNIIRRTSRTIELGRNYTFISRIGISPYQVCARLLTGQYVWLPSADLFRFGPLQIFYT